MVNRIKKLNLSYSSMWFGPRQAGKSTLIRNSLLKENHIEVNLLETDTYSKYLKDTAQFRKDIIYKIEKEDIKFVFVDEIQKIPELTNEIHNLMEKYPIIKFILSGSSARKLKRGNANLLGGRAVVEYLLPLTVDELKKDINLLEILQYGSLVGLYFNQKEEKIKKLRTYIDTYLKEEIAQEGLVRNFALFSRFLDIAGVYSSEIINYANISRETSSSLKTIQNYFTILYETLLAYELPAWDKSLKRQLSKHPKFYFIDNGINNAINKRLLDPLEPQIKGKLFEQWLINEIRTYILYNQREVDLHFWRTERGEFEVDLIISKHGKPSHAIEFKAKKKITENDVKSLIEFSAEYSKVKLLCVSECNSPYFIGKVVVLPYMEFLSSLKKEI